MSDQNKNFGISVSIATFVVLSLSTLLNHGCSEAKDSPGIDASYGPRPGFENSGTDALDRGKPEGGPAADSAAVADAFSDSSTQDASVVEAGTDVSPGNDGSTDSGTVQFDIRFDYHFDTQQAFDDSQRRALLEIAAERWSSYIKSEFEDVPAGKPLRARDPEHIDQPGVEFVVDYDIDDIAIMVGFTEIDGEGDALGSTSMSISATPVDAAEAIRFRERFYGSIFQPWVAQLSFDQAEDWFFDPTPETDDDVPIDKKDFLDTATHEIGHVLGFANCDAFRALVSEQTFVGPRAVEVFGGPVPLAPDLSHFEKDTQSRGQTPIMEHGSIRGQRKRPTELDLAVLEDIGYAIDWEAFLRFMEGEN